MAKKTSKKTSKKTGKTSKTSTKAKGRKNVVVEDDAPATKSKRGSRKA